MTKSIPTLRHVRILGLALGAVAVAAGAVWITASAAGLNVGFLSPASSWTPGMKTTAANPDQQTGKASSVCDDFVSHFAAALGTSQGKVDAAFRKAVGQTLDDVVKNGTLTRAQADATKKKIAGQAPCALLPSAAKPKAPSSQIGAYKEALLGAAAYALGITDNQLRTDLAQGMTLSQIAAAQSPPVTESQFRSGLIARLTPLLDAAVSNKQVTSAQEQAIIQQLQTGPIPNWDKPMHRATNPATATPSPNA